MPDSNPQPPSTSDTAIIIALAAAVLAGMAGFFLGVEASVAFDRFRGLSAGGEAGMASAYQALLIGGPIGAIIGMIVGGRLGLTCGRRFGSWPVAALLVLTVIAAGTYAAKQMGF